MEKLSRQKKTKKNKSKLIHRTHKRTQKKKTMQPQKQK